MDSTAFHVHRSLLCEASPVFKAAFLGGADYAETTAQEMTLSGPEITIEATEMLVQWLYTKRYELKPIREDDTQGRYMQLAALFVLAEKYIIVDLKNNIVDKLFELQATNFQPPQMAVAIFIYDNTPISSPFRLLLAAFFAWHVDMAWFDNTDVTNFLRFNPGLAADLAAQMGKRLSGKHQSPFAQPASLLYSSNSAGCSPRGRRIDNTEDTVEPQTDTLLEQKKEGAHA